MPASFIWLVLGLFFYMLYKMSLHIVPEKLCVFLFVDVFFSLLLTTTWSDMTLSVATATVWFHSDINKESQVLVFNFWCQMQWLLQSPVWLLFSLRSVSLHPHRCSTDKPLLWGASKGNLGKCRKSLLEVEVDEGTWCHQKKKKSKLQHFITPGTQRTSQIDDI